jgi:hypothetical protein
MSEMLGDGFIWRTSKAATTPLSDLDKQVVCVTMRADDAQSMSSALASFSR